MKRNLDRMALKNKNGQIHEVKINGIKNAESLTIIHDFTLELSDILAIAYEVGPVIRMKASQENTNQLIMRTQIWFQTQEQLIIASQKFTREIPRKIAFKPISDYEDKKTKMDPKVKSQVHKVSYKNKEEKQTPVAHEIRTQIFTPSKMNNNIKNNIKRRPDESTTRIFCMLPWNEDPELIEEEFFNHFSQFGLMNYHETVKDNKGRLSYGFIQYYNPKDTVKAIEDSDPKYGAKYARDRQIPKTCYTSHWEPQQRTHPECGSLVNVDVYHLHENTCRKQYKLRQRSSSIVHNIPLQDLEKLSKLLKTYQSTSDMTEEINGKVTTINTTDICAEQMENVDEFLEINDADTDISTYN